MPIAHVGKIVWSKLGLKLLLEQGEVSPAAVGPLHLATVSLWVNNINPDSNTTFTALGEVTVAQWAEYLAIATTGWGLTETRVDGSVLAVATPLLTWTGPAAGGGPTVRGAAVKSPLAGTPYLYAAVFTAPIPMTDNTQILDLPLPAFLLGGPVNF